MAAGITWGHTGAAVSIMAVKAAVARVFQVAATAADLAAATAVPAAVAAVTVAAATGKQPGQVANFRTQRQDVIPTRIEFDRCQDASPARGEESGGNADWNEMRLISTGEAPQFNSRQIGMPVAFGFAGEAVGEGQFACSAPREGCPTRERKI
jgi:hypothetical protein